MRELAARLRALVPAGASVSAEVAAIVEDVAARGDTAVLAWERRFGGGTDPLRVSAGEIAAALAALDPAVRAGLEVAVENVGAVAAAGVATPVELTLGEGHSVTLREVPVGRAAVYAPGGRAAYPSSVIMGVITARAAGVAEVVVAAPPHPAIFAACALCRVHEVYRMGGAQAIAALAHGTETVAAVDVIVGPGSLWVQEAKRQVSDRVGIDGFAGPSDLLVLASAGAGPEWIALDLRAQAEHGQGTLVVVASDDAGLLAAVSERVGEVAPAVFEAVPVPDMEAALALSEAFAPEHLQLVGASAEALAPRVTRAGCLFVGAESATAFGDYVAGSNHTLPTGGAARFASGLSTRHFRRRMSEVRVGAAAAALARAGAPVARAEGFEVHARSMEARVRQNGRPA